MSGAAREAAGRPPTAPYLDAIDAEVGRYLRELLRCGARLHGASDPSFQTVHVLRNAS